jgi:transposase
MVLVSYKLNAAIERGVKPCVGSNGPVEGQINRLKLIKRSGYGRMQLALLRQRVLYAAA